jgi:CPA2 family monovalent cation:H+ antiporter-2
MHHSPILYHVILVLTLALGVTLLLSRFRVPAVVGLLATGILAGPTALAVFPEAQAVEDLAEIGVVLLLFSIGLELSLKELFSMGLVAFGAGTFQVLATGAVAGTLVHLGLGAPVPVAVVVGCVVALSSTAVTARLLQESAQMEAPHGRHALAILVFQDLCVLPMTTLVAVLAAGKVDAVSIGLALARSVVLVAALVLLIRQVVPRILTLVVASRSSDLFVLGTLVVSLGTAWVGSLMGLSMPLGAFLAGLVVASSPYSHHAFAQVMPLRTVFNSIFFISVGMLVDLRFVAAHAVELATLTALVIVVKTVCAAVGLRLVGQRWLPAIATGLCLAQVGEFSFVLVQMAQSAGLMGIESVNRWTAVAVLTICVTPVLVAGAGRIGRWLARRIEAGPAAGAASSAEGHVILAGYGVNGRNLARVLKAVGIRYEALELNGIAVEACQEAGEPVHYGDATCPEALEHLGIRKAAKLVLSISDPAASRRAVKTARELAPDLMIVVRTRYVHEVERLYECGANQVVTDEMEASLRLVGLVLSHFNVPARVRQNLVEDIFNRHCAGLTDDRTDRAA